MVEPHSSNFRVITTNVLGVRIFRKFTTAYAFTSVSVGSGDYVVAKGEVRAVDHDE